ncbi:IDEAL domain-containing protein [Bacillus sp. PS06]|uniref:IDEAL domain-containing protein n=1 Tax=Bacillus sp. PS06 TaxID=2764176 RepID=UPI0017807DDE|nr:IDEAL domain-containing protein [Bacillus sp. PS06]MBD8067614.1 IDEAL domain-containing protein [Bacillus sp. PS06]
MKNEKSYTEMMKARGRMKKKDQVRILDIYIQMIIDEAVFKRKKDILEEKINDAIDSRNQPLFYELADEYKKLLTSAS